MTLSSSSAGACSFDPQSLTSVQLVSVQIDKAAAKVDAEYLKDHAKLGRKLSWYNGVTSSDWKVRLFLFNSSLLNALLIGRFTIHSGLMGSLTVSTLIRTRQ